MHVFMINVEIFNDEYIYKDVPLKIFPRDLRDLPNEISPALNIFHIR